MTNITELILKMLQGGTLQSLASSVGLGENQTKGALATVVPAILGLFMKKAQESGGAQSLLDTITKTSAGGAPGGIDLANLARAFTGQGQQNVQNAGTQILGQVLGGSSNIQSVVSALASHVGIDQGKTGQLLSLATPIVAGVLGKHASQQGGGANGLASVLQSQGDFLKGTLPAGLSSSLGLSGLLGGLGRQAAAGVGAATGSARDAAQRAGDTAFESARAAGKRGNPFLTRILPLLILLALAWWLWRSFNAGNVQPVPQAPPAATASPTVSTEAKMTPAAEAPTATPETAETPAAGAASPTATPAATPATTATPAP
jgi:hypothetical protein